MRQTIAVAAANDVSHFWADISAQRQMWLSRDIMLSGGLIAMETLSFIAVWVLPAILIREALTKAKKRRATEGIGKI